MKTFYGFERKNGLYGIRNNVICIAASNCVNSIVFEICNKVPELIPIRHSDGCGAKEKSPYLKRTLTNIALNPDIYGAIIVGLGCGNCYAEEIFENIRKEKPCVYININKLGGRSSSINKAVEEARKLLTEASLQKRVEAPVSSLILGTECGGSDALSGITANPTIGYLSDWLIAEGGTSILTEMAELIGCENILAERATTPQLKKDVYDAIVKIQQDVVKVSGLDSAGVSPGNMKGGISTIQEKSLGCVNKGGKSPVTGIIDYSERITNQKGLLIMNGTNYDPESLTGLFANGAHVSIFSSGRGSPLGFACCPVIKICSNTESYNSMPLDIDINAGAIISEHLSVSEMGDRAIAYFMDIINGKECRCEINKYCGPVGIAKKLIV